MILTSNLIELIIGAAIVALIVGIYIKITTTARKLKNIESFNHNAEQCKVELRYSTYEDEDDIIRVLCETSGDSHLLRKARAVRNLHKSLTTVENAIKPLLETRANKIKFSKETRTKIESEAIESLKMYYLTAKNEYVFSTEKYSRLIDLICISFYKLSEDFYEYKYTNDTKELTKTWTTIERYIPVLKAKLHQEYKTLIRQYRKTNEPKPAEERELVHKS